MSPRPELDTLRALAIGLVFWSHVEGSIAAGARLEGAWPAVFPWHQAFGFAGRTGVSLFFVLSAFLLSRPFFVEWRGGARVDLKSFARHRCWRILPLYVLAVAATAAFYATRPRHLARMFPYLGFV